MTKDEQILFDTDLAFAQKALLEGADNAFNEYLTEDALMLSDKSLPLENRKKIFSHMKGYGKKYILDWNPLDANVCESGEMGYTWGFFELRKISDDSVLNRGKYLNIWQKINGKWKVAVDMGNSNS